MKAKIIAVGTSREAYKLRQAKVPNTQFFINKCMSWVLEGITSSQQFWHKVFDQNPAYDQGWVDVSCLTNNKKTRIVMLHLDAKDDLKFNFPALEKEFSFERVYEFQHESKPNIEHVFRDRNPEGGYVIGLGFKNQGDVITEGHSLCLKYRRGWQFMDPAMLNESQAVGMGNNSYFYASLDKEHKMLHKGQWLTIFDYIREAYVHQNVTEICILKVNKKDKSSGRDIPVQVRRNSI